MCITFISLSGEADQGILTSRGIFLPPPRQKNMKNDAPWQDEARMRMALYEETIYFQASLPIWTISS